MMTHKMFRWFVEGAKANIRDGNAPLHLLVDHPMDLPTADVDRIVAQAETEIFGVK